VIRGNANVVITGGVDDGYNSGNNGLTYAGTGTLTLDGTNIYTGNTTVESGVIQVTGSLANNGSTNVFIAAGTDFTSAVIGRQVSVASGSYSGLGSTAMGNVLNRLGTSADIVAGSNSGTFTGASQANVSMAWRVRGMNETPGAVGALVSPLISDIIRLTGMTTASADPSPTDPFTLQMTYKPTLLGSEARESLNGSIYLAWLNPNGAGTGTPVWQNAVLGNFGNNATRAEQNFQGSFAAFQLAIGDTNVANYIGAWGVDTINHDVWAVLNHNSEFGVVPEPGTVMLLLIATGFLAVARLSISR